MGKHTVHKWTTGAMVAIALGCTFASPAAAVDLRGTAWDSVGKTEGVDPLYLYSVALLESGHTEGGVTRPWPWALNIEGRSVYPATRAEAEQHLARALAAGKRNIDIGLMQINLRVHGERVSEPRMLLDPEVNLKTAAGIAKTALTSSKDDVVIGAGRYHSWRDSRARWYGQRVLALYAALRTLEIRREPQGEHLPH